MTTEQPTPETLQQWHDELEETGQGLTPWEEDFLAKMGDKLDKGYTLTPAQVAKLEEIHAERAP